MAAPITPRVRERLNTNKDLFLVESARQNQLSHVRVALKAGASPHAGRHGDNSTFESALALTTSRRMARLLLDAGASPDGEEMAVFPSRNPCRPLRNAVLFAQPVLVEMLLAHGAHAHHCDHDGWMDWVRSHFAVTVPAYVNRPPKLGDTDARAQVAKLLREHGQVPTRTPGLELALTSILRVSTTTMECWETMLDTLEEAGASWTMPSAAQQSEIDFYTQFAPYLLPYTQSLLCRQEQCALRSAIPAASAPVPPRVRL